MKFINTKTIFKRTNLVVIALLTSLFLISLGCINIDSKGDGMMILDDMTSGETKVVRVGDYVSVEYVGRLTDGSIFDSSVGRDPLDFTVGSGQLIKGFDEGVIGMKVGEKKFITIPPEKGYGLVIKENIIVIEKESFANFDEMKVGMIISSGVARGKIISKNDSNATIDFNHELAGKTLVFEVTLLSIK